MLWEFRVKCARCKHEAVVVGQGPPQACPKCGHRKFSTMEMNQRPTDTAGGASESFEKSQLFGEKGAIHTGTPDGKHRKRRVATALVKQILGKGTIETIDAFADRGVIKQGVDGRIAALTNRMDLTEVEVEDIRRRAHRKVDRAADKAGGFRDRLTGKRKKGPGAKS